MGTMHKTSQVPTERIVSRSLPFHARLMQTVPHQGTRTSNLTRFLESPKQRLCSREHLSSSRTKPRSTSCTSVSRVSTSRDATRWTRRVSSISSLKVAMLLTTHQISCSVTTSSILEVLESICHIRHGILSITHMEQAQLCEWV